MTLKLGIIKENKQPVDPRAALSPGNCKQLIEEGHGFNLVIESSSSRTFADKAYTDLNITVVKDISEADILLGVKEVPIKNLIAGKTYLFFSHTIKEQPYNRDMLKAILDKKIELIDYETLTHDNGRRILGFGRYAGIVGAYNGLLTWGKKHHTFALKPAHKCKDFAEMKEELSKIEVAKIKMVITGGGRVSRGAVEVLEHCNVKKLSPADFIDYDGKEAVYCLLEDGDLFERKDKSAWDNFHFYENHEEYNMKLKPYLSETDLLINGIYWEEDLPVFFTKEDTAGPMFRIKVIADVTCDVEGSIPITLRATPIQDPVIGWDPKAQKECDPFLANTIDVMAVTNLPAELPANASHGFGEDLIKYVLPEFLKTESAILHRAKITTKEGKLNAPFSYLKDYVS
jgi:alanine dehydrogenase